MSSARNEKEQQQGIGGVETPQSRHVSVAGARPRPMIRKVGSNVGPLPSPDVDVKRTKSGVRPAQAERSYVGPLPVPRTPPPKPAPKALAPAEPELPSATPTEVWVPNAERSPAPSPIAAAPVPAIDMTMPLVLPSRVSALPVAPEGAPARIANPSVGPTAPASSAAIDAADVIAPRRSVLARLDKPGAGLSVRTLAMVAAAVALVAITFVVATTKSAAPRVATPTNTGSPTTTGSEPAAPAATTTVTQADVKPAEPEVPVVTPTSLPPAVVDVKNLPPALPAWATAPVNPATFKAAKAPAAEPPAESEPAPAPESASPAPAADTPEK